MIARTFRDIWSLVMFLKFSRKTSLVPIYHELHSRSYDFVACIPNPYKRPVIFEELPFCHFPPPNTSIRG